jgi:hypothetical protein
MQFAGKSGIAVFVLLIAGGVAVGFGSGLLVGRQFPAHRFERFGETRFLLDPTTGKVCDPFKNPAGASAGPSQQGESLDEYLKQFQPSSNYPPPCGK